MLSQEVMFAIYTWATVTLAVIAVLAGIVGYFQLRSMRRAKEWDSAQAIMGELRSPDRIKLLSRLYSMDRDVDKLRESNEIDNFSIFVSRLEWVGIMVKRKQMSLNLVMELIGALPSRIWYILGPYIESEAINRGKYASNFRRLVQDTLVCYVAKVPRAHWARLATPSRAESVDLVPYLLKDMGLASSPQFQRVLFGRRLRAICGKDLRMPKERWEELVDIRERR